MAVYPGMEVPYLAVGRFVSNPLLSICPRARHGAIRFAVKPEELA